MRKEEKVEQKIWWGAIGSPILGIIGLLMVLIVINVNFTNLMLLIFWLSPIAAIGAILLGLTGLIKIYKNPSLKGKWGCIMGIILGVVILLIMYWFLQRTKLVEYE